MILYENNSSDGDFHFIFKKIEACAATRCLFLKDTQRYMFLSQLPEPTLNLLKRVSFLRPFRTILPNHTILSLSRKFPTTNVYELFGTNLN